MPATHIKEESLELYAMGILSESCIPDVEEHLLTCSFCQYRLLETDEFVIQFRQAAAQARPCPAPFWRKFHTARELFWTSALVATAVILLLIMGEPRLATLNPAVVLLQALRGPEARAQMAAGRPYLIVFDLPLDSPDADYETEIVDAVGRVVLKPTARIAQSRLSALIDRLAPGDYWVRVYQKQSARELVAEYGLQVNRQP